MCFHKPVYFRLQIDQAIPAKAICIPLIHKRPLFFRYQDPKTLALRNISRLAGKSIATAGTFAGFVVTHGRRGL